MAAVTRMLARCEGGRLMSGIGFLIKRLTKDERDLEEGRERQAIDCPGKKDI